MKEIDAITPPSELIEHWIECSDSETMREMILEVARWGADRELEMCCKWLGHPAGMERLRAARRPTPSLNEIALQMLGTIERDARYLPEITATIRRALEEAA